MTVLGDELVSGYRGMNYGLVIKLFSKLTLNYISKLLLALKAQRCSHGHRHEEGKCKGCCNLVLVAQTDTVPALEYLFRTFISNDS